MALYKRSVDFLPKPTTEEIEEEYKLSRTSLYSAMLPLFASLIWLASVGVGAYFKEEIKKADQTILERNSTIATYHNVRKKQTELVLKIEALKPYIIKDFYPQDFFDKVSKTIKSTGDAQAKVYAYERDSEGVFSIQGKANSYLDLAKIMVAFNSHKDFDEVVIDSIHYDRDLDDVNFQISFIYQEELES